MYVQAKGGRGGKDGRDNCTRVYSGTGEVLGIDDGKEGGVERFFTSSEVWKKTPKVFHSHCQKKKPRTWKWIRQTRVYDEIVRHKYGNAFTLLWAKIKTWLDMDLLMQDKMRFWCYTPSQQVSNCLNMVRYRTQVAPSTRLLRFRSSRTTILWVHCSAEQKRLKALNLLKWFFLVLLTYKSLRTWI